MSQTLYTKTGALFDRIDPLSKLLWGTIMMIWTLYIGLPLYQVFLFLVLLLIGRLLAGVGFVQMIKSVRVFLIFGLFMIVFQTLFAQGEEVIWSWGVLRATREGLDAGLNVGLRLIVIVTISSILAFTTDPRRLVVALIEIARVPYRFAYAVYSTLRFIPLMQHDATIILQSQTIRGARMDKSLISRVKQYVGLLVPLIAGGIRQASTSAIALDSRAFGYQKTRTNLIKVSINPAGPILIAISLVFMIVYIAIGPQADLALMY